ncbi:1-(5-phosphoribosyl)-5-[(5-phosphoribosylamino)methylideneamino]imidazole-4-carboxamide isomerase [Sulfurihydrogenibium azorense]|jgi:phosphoribosylformimino-5-aminoimidazole carboxamide ribotide isomerase|uniref:1-(5-phosphoribosyl)-5-[(5- phosphoribosylamino)methylideneamino]imidazole-4- carboxamide isomerase n=1 Tax=Sulfurihydrogenibium azorense TaxID=309806 RepID=UPI0024096C4D|nr:1-(5-phosphoribosyl)-5-[(5-phosphoribosylamino)methylideneamino]imidazole-4-carboxamide isomerase [Sulfurihydrogenibium azorense]MDM7273903.1 1-(5-phosphoribosyl)-5-[(5-phosphoribosylamino)methylideneamino]imidazole-4-carboxamide isomerase [Sulfurihydrogenibium azorense]
MGLKEFIIPAIDLKDGKVVRLYKGEFDKVKVYKDNPVDMAKYFQDCGAVHIHVVDLDGALEGKPKNYKVVESIVKSVDILVEFGGGLRSYEAVKSMFEIGVDRVVIGSLAYENQEEFLRIVEDFKNKVIVGIDAKDGKVAIKGWVEKTDYTPLEFAKKYDDLDIFGFLYTDVNRDGAMVGPNIEGTKYLAENLKHWVIASGGVGSLQDVVNLYKLKDYGVFGVVVGKAIYEGKIKLEEL